MNTPSEMSSVGEAVSGRGGEEVENVSDDQEEDIFYIPERRPSLDLGSSPMETENWCFGEPAVCPVQSYGSMYSDGDSAKGETEEESPTGINLRRTDSFSSCYSFDSDNCEKKTLKIKIKDEDAEPSDEPEDTQEPEEVLHPSYTVRFVFMAICDALKELKNTELEYFKLILWEHYPESFKTTPRSMDIVDIVDRLLECYSLDASLKTIKKLLNQMRQNEVCESLENACVTNEVCYEMREHLKQKYRTLDGEFIMSDGPRSFDELYVDLFITSTFNNGPNVEHGVLTIPKLHTNKKPNVEVTTKSILESKDNKEIHARLIFITGVAGSGKSMVFRRLIFDWIEDELSRSLLIPLTVTELKQFEDKKASFVEMIQTIYPETSKLNFSDLNGVKEHRTVFIFDGLDELKEKVLFKRTMIHSDPMEPAPLTRILANLLEGRMFSHSFYIVLCRPLVRSWIAYDLHYELRELHGFHAPEREEYFKRRFADPAQASRVLDFVRSSGTLRAMCHLPLFCSLLAKECERVFREEGPRAKLPTSITHVYTKLLLEIIQRRKSGSAFCEEGKESEFVLTLGKLALGMLEQGKYSLSKHDWKESGAAPEEAANCGLLTQFTVTIHVLLTEKERSFIHPTVQEYCAALYAYLTFANAKKNIFEQHLKDKFKEIFKGPRIMELYKCAVEKTLQQADGKLDMFLCFLFGMANRRNQELLQQFCSSGAKIPEFAESAAALLRKKMREHPQRTSTLERCLAELEM